MTGGYEGEGSLALVGGHAVVKSAGGSLAGVGALAYPVDGHAEDSPSHHGQVERAGAMAHAAAIFAGADIQAQVQTGLDAPVAAVGLEHLQRAELGLGPGRQQILRFDFFRGPPGTVKTAGQPGRLFHKRESHALGGGGENEQGARFEPAAVEFTNLKAISLIWRGKRRATDPGQVVARSPRPPFGCL